ncbi:MAG: DUF397 domain-containing protein [Actinomycetota bacterium]|nr:DUF397 domain-containing protein [Actinomycetota bacterium]
MTATRPDFTSASFKTSSFTESNGTCVEAAVIPDHAALRDTKHREGGHLTVPTAAFTRLISALRG